MSIDYRYYTALTLAQNEAQGQLIKIALFYNSSGKLIEEYKTFPDAQVGDVCLGRTYTYMETAGIAITPYEDSGVTGTRAFVTTWNQAMEDQVAPSAQTIIDINLSSTSVLEGSLAGTVVGTLTIVGGLAPFSFVITADPDAEFQINGNLLELADTAVLAESPYSVTIKATAVNGAEFTKIFAITVTPLFANDYSTDFDGINDNVNFGNNYGFDRSVSFSISFWMKAQNFAANRNMIDKIETGGAVQGYRIGHDATGKIYVQLRTTTNALGPQTCTTSLTAGVWYHIMVTYAGGSNIDGLKIYVNGVQDHSTFASTALTGTMVNTSNFVVGNYNSTSDYSGKIDELAVYNVELTTTQISDIYNGGSPNSLDLLSSAPNLQSWWRMGDGDTYPTILDQVAAINGTMTNMSAANFVLDTP